MYLIVGLGNPGSAYAKNRHNVGFQVLDFLAVRHDFKFEKKNFDAIWGKGTIAGQEVILAKPQTYMNLSGKAIGQLANFYKLEKNQIMVIYDDMDLPVGKIRVRANGSSGGQNGLKDILRVLGSNDVPRLRVGVGRPMRGVARDHVLNDFSKDEEIVIQHVYEKTAMAVESWLTEGVEIAMNKFNG
jgi:peptidyl-tRNA hydrolase, PTH1 family